MRTDLSSKLKSSLPELLQIERIYYYKATINHSCFVLKLTSGAIKFLILLRKTHQNHAVLDENKRIWDLRELREFWPLLPLAYQIYLWCLQVANKGHFPAVLAINCAWFSPVSLVSVLVSSFWPHDLSSHDGENKAFGALLLLRSNEDSLWCLTDGFWVGLFLISQGELLWTKVSTGLQVIPPGSVLTIPYPEDIINHVNMKACHGWNHSC